MRTGSAKTNEAQVVETAMNVGEALDLNALVPDGGAWKSGNDGIATVSAEGIVKALAAGIAEFTGLDNNGEQITVIITISDDPAGAVADLFRAGPAPGLARIHAGQSARLWYAG